MQGLLSQTQKTTYRSFKVTVNLKRCLLQRHFPAWYLNVNWQRIPDSCLRLPQHKRFSGNSSSISQLILYIIRKCNKRENLRTQGIMGRMQRRTGHQARNQRSRRVIQTKQVTSAKQRRDPCSRPSTDPTNYQKRVSNFPSVWFAN